VEPDEYSVSGVGLGEGTVLHRRSIVVLLAAVGVGALLAWVVSRARERSPGPPADYATGTTSAPDPPAPPSTGPAVNVPAVTTEWVPVRKGFAVLGSDAEDHPGDHNGQPLSATPRPVREAPLPREGLLSGSTLLGLAVVVGLVAVGLGAWAFATRDARTKTVTLTVTRSPHRLEQALTVVAAQSTERIPLAHSVGRIVLAVTPAGRALLVVHGLGRAPAGKSYQAWVIPPGKTVPVSAAVFGGEEPVVLLRRDVARGAVVAVTLERAGGAKAPSHAPTLVGKRSA
jgi:Anti-sigma-K factor rskA